jgi:F0F1-type ATP synthase assembly protein I
MFNGFGVYVVLFSEIGITFFVGTIAGVLAGWWIDQQLHTLPVFAVGGALAGFGLSGLAVARLIRRFLARFDTHHD